MFKETRQRRFVANICLMLMFAPFLTCATAEEAQKEQEESAAPQIEMLGVGFREPEWPDAKSGEKWWGLFETDDGKYELVETTISVSERTDDCTDESIPFISIKDKRYPLFLARGSNRFKTGCVDTVPLPKGVDGYPRLLPGEQYHVNQCRPFYDVLFALGNVVGPRYPRVKDYTLNIREQMREDGIVQELLHVPDTDTEEPFPTINWIGDLDRDGRMDLLVDAQPYPGGPLVLFLSSFAEKGEILHKVAELMRRSC